MSDLIDRKLAKDAIHKKLDGSSFDGDLWHVADDIDDILDELPSASTELSNNSPKLDNKNGGLISRQDAIKYFAELWECIEAISDREEWEDVCVTTVNEIKSAQLERPKGEWIPHKSIFGGLGEKVYTCNQCGCNIGFHIENFCPRCGSYNGGGEDDEVS